MLLIMVICFSRCKQLKEVKLKCRYDASNPQLFANLFKDCNALTAGSIKVPNDFYPNYTSDATIKKMFGDYCDVEEANKKFAAY